MIGPDLRNGDRVSGWSPARPRTRGRQVDLERSLSFGLVAGQQRIDPGPGDPVTAGHLADRALFNSDSSNDQPGL